MDSIKIKFNYKHTAILATAGFVVCSALTFNPNTAKSADLKLAQNAQSPTASPSQTTQTTSTKKACPSKLSSGPSAGGDLISKISASISNLYKPNNVTTASETTDIPDLSKIGSSAAKVALGEVGKKYVDDLTPYNGYNGNQWCAYFVTWAMRKASLPIPKMGGSKQVLQWYKENGHSTFRDPAQAGAGDIVVWDRGGDKGHIGMVITNYAAAGQLGIVEGNTSRNEVKYYTYTYEEVRTKANGLVGFGRW